ncbi:MAG TPA: bifunctional demethylmenaquinone methyltransferase/2-methoxy-6-polyprenyl-1,4-benzoquinol methylase UbiE [Bacteroidaceae bacterium]|nr:bifunctional demethylmenaquinone methyltransferase/2-methoxy-6-polyprenyl-1,4-benzoquinol methylase UbiE [Bacteroidaceae bacterium]
MKYSQEKILPYNTSLPKTVQLEVMFNKIAPVYDRLNRILSWGFEKKWRKKASGIVAQSNPDSILDIACGTGDMAICMADNIKPDIIIAADISEGMMNVGREKANQAGLSNIIKFQKENCEMLSFADCSFDSVTSAFGVRNFENLDNALTEMNRVLKDSGRLVILELSYPDKFPIKQLFSIYARLVIPNAGRLLSKDNKAYKYLPETMKVFYQGNVMKKIIEKAGFCEVSFLPLTMGICTLYMARKKTPEKK